MGTTNHLPLVLWDFWQVWYWLDLLLTNTVTGSSWLWWLDPEDSTLHTPSKFFIVSVSLLWWCSLSLSWKEINIDVLFRTKHPVAYSPYFDKLCISLLITASYKKWHSDQYWQQSRIVGINVNIWKVIWQCASFTKYKIKMLH